VRSEDAKSAIVVSDSRDVSDTEMSCNPGPKMRDHVNWARHSGASVGPRGSGGNVGGTRSCTLLASCLPGQEGLLPRRPSAVPTRIPNTAIQTGQFLDRGGKRAISDTVTSFAAHSVVAPEAAAHNQRV